MKARQFQVLINTEQVRAVPLSSFN